MLNRFISLLGIGLALALLPAWGQTERGKISFSTTTSSAPRAALVIGNASYAGDARLANPINDARAVRDALKGLGFTVEYLEDGTLREMEASVNKFTRRLSEGSVGMCFYAGHGLQVGGENYLQPIDAGIADEVDVRFKCLSANQLLDKMAHAGSSVNILMLDACRNNPFTRSFRKSRSVGGGGLANMQAPEGTVIAFATAPGKLAADGAGDHSPFTAAWLAEVKRPQPVETLYKRVRQQVHTATRKKQTPFLLSSLVGEFAFVPVTGKSPAPAATSSAPFAPRPSAFAGTKAGQQKGDNALGMKFQWCPPGAFTMGSPKSEDERRDNENQVRVELSGFWLGTYEVTQSEWKAVMGTSPSWFSGSKLPVESVNWENALAFCEKLSTSERRAGRLPADWVYSLPSEAEWEYGCRAGTTTATAFGNSLLSQEANFSGEKTRDVGSYRSNGWGLYDLHGNVYEWCADRYATNLPGGKNPLVKDGDSQVYRGGSWTSFGGNCRSANRSSNSPDFRVFYLGFRVACVPSSGLVQ